MPNWKMGKYSRSPLNGELKIVWNSSLRKLARAMRRGRVPDERQVIIDQAMINARRRWPRYGHKHPPV
jgi:hypothetical protein